MKDRIYNTRAMVEAGLISALVVIIMLLNVYVPIFSTLGTFILPIPITVLYIRHNYKVAISSVIVSAILIGMVYNPLSALTASILFGATGITLGYCIKSEKEAGTTIMLLAAVLVAAMSINFTIYANFIDKTGIVGFINRNIIMMQESLDMTKEIYGKMGVTEEQLAPIEKTFEVFTTDFVLKLIPAILVIVSFTSAYFNYSITRAILKRLKYNVKEGRPFSKIHINTRIGTIVVLFLIVGILLNKRDIPIGGYITNSAQVVFQLMLLLDGASLAVHYLRNRFNMSKVVTALILIFTISSQISMIYVYIGLADMLFDFRKLDPYRRKPIEE